MCVCVCVLLSFCCRCRYIKQRFVFLINEYTHTCVYVCVCVFLIHYYSTCLRIFHWTQDDNIIILHTCTAKRRSTSQETRRHVNGLSNVCQPSTESEYYCNNIVLFVNVTFGHPYGPHERRRRHDNSRENDSKRHFDVVISIHTPNITPLPIHNKIIPGQWKWTFLEKNIIIFLFLWQFELRSDFQTPNSS